MLVHISEVLTPRRAAAARDSLESADWVDGEITAGYQSARAKHNLQLPEDHPVRARAPGDDRDRRSGAEPALHGRGAAVESISAAVQPLRGGESFGTHVDNAIRQVPGTPHRIRTDLSATLFLTPPEEYDGGELIVEDTYGTHSVKLPAGIWCSIHPPACTTCARSRAAPASASFFWIQSMVRDDGQRTAAVRSGHGDPADCRRGAGPSLRRAAHRRLSQPDSHVGGGIADERYARFFFGFT